jgi:hypothetical protein
MTDWVRGACRQNSGTTPLQHAVRRPGGGIQGRAVHPGRPGHRHRTHRAPLLPGQSAPGAPAGDLLQRSEVATPAIGPRRRRRVSGCRPRPAVSSPWSVPERRHLWLLATGTALGVYLHSQTVEPWERFSAWCWCNVRTAGELAYGDTIAALQVHGLHLPGDARSRAPRWPVHGRVTSLLDHGWRSTRGCALTDDSHLMLCGNSEMIRTFAPVGQRTAPPPAPRA